MKKGYISQVFTVAAFVISLAVFMVLTFIVPRDDKSAELEQRELATLPELTLSSAFSGDFERDFETYLTDNVGFRSTLMALSSRLESLKGIKPEGGKLVTASKDLGTGADGTKNLLILKDRVMEVFHKNDSARESYIEMLNGYADLFGDNVQLYSMIVPTQIEFNPAGEGLSDSELDTIDYIYNNIDKRINAVNVYDTLKAHSDDYIYFRTDHHWTGLGALYAYEKFTELKDGEPSDVSGLHKYSRDGFLGYLYNQANDRSLAEYADTIEWFDYGKNYDVNARAASADGFTEYKTKIYSIPPTSEAPKYSIFMGGDHQFARIETDLENGRTLLVIKDSYANALIPLLCRDYSEILVIDPRNFYSTVSELIKEYEIDDCLIINYVFTTTFPDFIAKLNEVR